MKRALQIILPILLAIAVIFSIGWYFIKYDPDFTRDLLVARARRSEENGNHSMAIWFYELAYRQSGNDQDVAVELAMQYKASGHYTKAEYTLSNAIADGATAELYMALCQTYVEQDKLLDAVTMLDSISDPIIKAVLDAKRPAAPTATPEHGYYNQYITVSLQAKNGTIYMTTDGTYPSTADNRYTGPITLPGGETTIEALAVSDDGLVSPLAIMGYTVAGVVEEVTLTDPAIDKAVRDILKVSSDHALYTDELWTITSFIVPRDAKSLTDLAMLPFLEELIIRNGDFESLSSLSTLSSLQTLVIGDTAVETSDLKVIAGLPKLTSLTMTGCSLSSVSPLASATALIYLDLSNNTIRDLSPLSNMPNLETVLLSHNAITGLDVFGTMEKLVELDVSYNSITSVAPLAGTPSLATLNLTSNSLTTLSGLETITSLRALYVAFNKLTDVSMLSANTNLGELDVSNNSITDITALRTLNQLFSFNFSYNQVTKLPQFAKDCALVVIKGSENKLSSLEELSGLQNLNTVIMDHNTELRSVAPLATCYNLVEVSVYGTNVRDVSVLREMNVIVMYSPVLRT